MTFPLGREASAAGYRVIGYDSIGSTNAEALAAAGQGDAGRLWFAARQQTQGRGRRGRAWAGPYGNLAASLLIIPDAGPAELATLGFVAGIALNGALAQVLPGAVIHSGLDGFDGTADSGGVRVALKWPNDVVADGAKLAGILLESGRRPDGTPAIVVGFGVNVAVAPEGLPYPATSLASLGSRADADAVFELLAESWVEAFALWDNGRGLKPVLDQWRNAAAGLGGEVAVQREGSVLRGRFETVDDSGRLILRDDAGDRIAITAGDVHFGTTATLRPNSNSEA